MEETQQQEQKITRMVILHYNDDGEVAIGVNGGYFEPQEIIAMLDVAKAKLELVLVREMISVHEQQRYGGRIVAPDGNALL